MSAPPKTKPPEPNGRTRNQDPSIAPALVAILGAIAPSRFAASILRRSSRRVSVSSLASRAPSVATSCCNPSAIPRALALKFIQHPASRTTGWTRCLPLGKTSSMARYNHNVYAKSKTPRYVVVFDLQWKIVDCQRLEPCTDLRSAMTATIGRLTQEGWQPEGTPDFGFVFKTRGGIRRLLILTERDPYDTRPQTFSPWVSP